MRFQCRIGTIAQTEPTRARLATAQRPDQLKQVKQVPQTQQRSAAKGRDWPMRAAIASAILVASGCAALDPRAPAPWKVEPVFNVTHSVQTSQAYYSLGQYFDGSMAWDKAIDAYRKAIAADAHNTEAYNALGVALAQAGRYRDAETTLRQAVALAPDRTHVRNNLGYVLLMAGKPVDAAVELKAAVDQDGSNAIARANLRDALDRSAAAAPATTVAVVRPAPLDQRDDRMTVDAPVAVPAPAAAIPITSSLEKPVRASTLEVSNGNGVPGMAARVGHWLELQGMPTHRLSNQQSFTQRLTVVQYRSGHEQAARHVAESLPANAKAEPRPTPGLRSEVRVILGRDWVQTAACLERQRCRAVVSTVAAVATR
jgi:tetratricopeptide (TPR) repeat protein